jgi:hypothetical protein
MFRSAYGQISAAERRFVDRLVDGLAEAARQANQSIRLMLSHALPDSVRRNDHHGWLDRPLVQAAIAERVLQRADADEVNPQSYLSEIVGIGTFDITDYMTIDDFGRPSIDMVRLQSDGKSGAIKQIDVDYVEGRGGERVKIRIQAHDKIAALKMWAAYMGLDTGDSTSRRAERAAQEMPLITESVSATEAGEAYARLIGDDE